MKLSAAKASSAAFVSLQPIRVKARVAQFEAQTHCLALDIRDVALLPFHLAVQQIAFHRFRHSQHFALRAEDFYADLPLKGIGVDEQLIPGR